MSSRHEPRPTRDTAPIPEYAPAVSDLVPAAATADSSAIGGTLDAPAVAPTGLRALLHGERPIWIVCGLLILVGAWLRARHLDLPAEFSFDERHFVKNARRYLLCVRDGNDHPPFGKLLMSLSIGLVGNHPAGWRLPALLSGWLNIGLAAALGRMLFRDRLAGLLAATFVAADGFLLVYSRTALLDGPLTTLFLGCALAALGARRPLHIGIAAVLAGMACCVKFSGIVLTVPLLLACVLARPRLPRWTPLLLALVPLTYGLIYSFALAWTELPAGPAGVVAATGRLVDMHLGKTEWEHRWVSHWYTWFVPVRPVVMRWHKDGDVVQTMNSLGNLAVWWGSELLLLGAFWKLARAAPAALRARFGARVDEGRSAVARVLGTGFFGEHARAVAWLSLLWLLPIVPWTITRRDSYVYHYLPGYSFGVVLLGGGVAWLLRHRPRLGWAALGTVGLVFLLYIPIWTEMPISRAVWRTLLFLPMWR